MTDPHELSNLLICNRRSIKRNLNIEQGPQAQTTTERDHKQTKQAYFVGLRPLSQLFQYNCLFFSINTHNTQLCDVGIRHVSYIRT